MAKRKRKITRPQYTAKAIRARQAPKKPVPKELKIGIAFCVGALILALVLFLTLYDDGALPVVNGVPQMEGDNWLVADLSTGDDPRYFKIGEVAPLDGYAADPDAETVSSDLVLQYFTPLDTDSRIDHYYVTATARDYLTSAQSANDNFRMYGLSDDLTEVKQQMLGGLQAAYFIASFPASESQPAQQQALAYLPTPRDTTVLISVTVPVPEGETPLPEDELATLLDGIAGTVTFEEA